MRKEIKAGIIFLKAIGLAWLGLEIRLIGWLGYSKVLISLPIRYVIYSFRVHIVSRLRVAKN